jgi:DNA primase
MDFVSYLASRGVVLTPKPFQLAGTCPICKTNAPSWRQTFWVRPSRNIWYCFACRRGGHAINLVAELEGCSGDEAADLLGLEHRPEHAWRLTEKRRGLTSWTCEHCQVIKKHRFNRFDYYRLVNDKLVFAGRTLPECTKLS